MLKKSTMLELIDDLEVKDNETKKGVEEDLKFN